MSFIYSITNMRGAKIGVVENKKDILPYLLFEGHLDIQDLCYNNECDIHKMLECEPTINAIIQKAETLPYIKLLIILNHFGFRVDEEKIWSYTEYKHNHALD